jgi:phosphoserine phosphatase RsbU/P
MSLIVAAADADVSAGLLDRVNEIEAGAVASPDLASVLHACEHPGGPDCVICCDLAWARRIVDAAPRLPVVLATSSTPDSELLLSALRAGLADVWPLPMPSVAMQERLQSIRTRFAVSTTTTERQLVEYARELERDQREGRYIQMSMLPPSPTSIGRYGFEHRIVPSMFMSGDFVDCFPVSDRHFVFYVADVSGHGASSAFVTVLLKDFARRLRRERQPGMLENPGLILEWVNDELLQQKIDKHVALVLGVGDLVTDQIALVNAGHYPPAIRVSAEGPEFLRQKGKPLGLFDRVAYDARTVELQSGDRLVLFSDGVLDAMGADSLALREARLLAAAATGGLQEIWATLGVDGADVRRADDMTCLVVRREN